MIYVINRPELLALEFYKSRPFKGSDKGFEVTPDEQKGSKQFDFSEEGLCEAIAWLNENHDTYAQKKQ